jgi:hypothetical protein
MPSTLAVVDDDVAVRQLVGVEQLAGVELGAERVGRGRERRRDGARGRDLVEEVALRLEAVADAALALDDGRVVDGALALDGQQLSPPLLAQLVARDVDRDLRPDAPLERDGDAVRGRVEPYLGLVEARGEVAGVDDGAADARHVLAERGLREARAGLELQPAEHFGERRAFEALHVNLKRFDRGGRARPHVEDDRRARVRGVGARVVRGLGAVEAAVVQVGHDGLGALAQRGLRHGLARLKEGHARAQLVLGDLRAEVGADGELDALDRDARPHDEAQRDAGAAVGARARRVPRLDARGGDAARVEERLQGLAHEHGREGRARGDAQPRAQLGQRGLVERRLLHFERHALDRPPLVPAQVGREARGVFGRRGRGRQQ